MGDMNTMTFQFPERDDLFIGADAYDQMAYHDALDAAEEAGEPPFTFEEFMARVAARARKAASVATTLPAPPDSDDDNIPF